MVSVKLIGRLGNQLYQYAVCIAYSLKYNIPYCIPSHTLNDTVWKPYKIGFVNYCNNHGISTATVWKEPSHAYHEIPKIYANRIILDGYFQSYKYFEFFIDEIRESLNFNYKTIKDICGIHIRRGDYVTLPNHHPVCTLSYYADAINEIANNRIYKFKVYSDDINWCKEYINESLGGNYDCVFEYSENKTELEDFEELMRCEHQIISNSSFSLMAAILNINPNKIVISPHEDNWFGKANKKLDVKDLIPQNFIRIKY